METYKEFLGKIRKEFYESIEMAANLDLSVEFKEPIYKELVWIGKYMKDRRIDIENPECMNKTKRKILEELFPEIKKVKSFLEETISLDRKPISNIKN